MRFMALDDDHTKLSLSIGVASDRLRKTCSAVTPPAVAPAWVE
jgi:hypothetical protein